MPVVFESSEIVVGANRRRVFRKDTGMIAFSRREAIGLKLKALRPARRKADDGPDAKQIGGFGNPVFSPDCG